MANPLSVHSTAVVTLVLCLIAKATFGAPVAEPKLSPSQFVSSVLRELLPAETVSKIEVPARSGALELNEEVYRSLPSSKNDAVQYREASAPFQQWLEQSLQMGINKLGKYSGEYRSAVNKLEQFQTAVDSLSKLQFSKPQVEFFAKFLHSYFSATNPSTKPQDILNAFRGAVAELHNSTKSEGEKRSAQLRQGRTADVGVAASELVTIASTGVSDVAASDTVALEATGSYLDTIMNALEALNNLPWYVTVPLSIAFPPFSPVIHGLRAIPCFYNARGAWTFQSIAAWGPWLLCNLNVIKLLPLGSEAEIVLQILYKALEAGLSYAG